MNPLDSCLVLFKTALSPTQQLLQMVCAMKRALKPIACRQPPPFIQKNAKRAFEFIIRYKSKRIANAVLNRVSFCGYTTPYSFCFKKRSRHQDVAFQRFLSLKLNKSMNVYTFLDRSTFNTDLLTIYSLICKYRLSLTKVETHFQLALKKTPCASTIVIQTFF